MKKLSISIELLSPALIGSAGGYGAIIDSDIVFDDLGIPYIPSKRIKGCLRDSALEVCEILKQANLEIIDLSAGIYSGFQVVDNLFGIPGQQNPAPLIMEDLMLKDYENLRQWLHFLNKKRSSPIHPEVIRELFTEIRQQTSIDENGIAKDGSLRTIRVARKGLIFEGPIELLEPREEYLILLSFAVKNLSRFGTKRTRGYGEISCSLFEDSVEIYYLSKLEEQVCKIMAP